MTKQTVIFLLTILLTLEAAAQAAHPGSATRYTICHIQLITDQDVPRFGKLGVIAQFAIENEQLQWVEPGENIDPDKGVRVTEQLIQLGLTRKEIDGIVERQEKLIERIDKGKIDTF